MAATGVQFSRETIDGLVDREQLRETQELWHVNKAEEHPPMEDILNGEKIIDKKYDAALMNTIGHELNHLVVAYKLGVPMYATTLTALPQGNILGQVTLPDHVDYGTLQIIATAGSVPAHDGSARGYGSDIYKAKLIEQFGMGTSVQEARRKAESLINFYSSDVRMMCAKIIAFLQTEKHMSHIPGEMLHKIEARARYELKARKVKVKMPVFFKPPSIEEKIAAKQKEDTPGRPPDKRTIMEWMPDNLYRVTYLTDGNVELSFIICRVCNSRDGHTAECKNLKKSFISDAEKDAQWKQKITRVYPPDPKQQH